MPVLHDFTTHFILYENCEKSKRFHPISKFVKNRKDLPVASVVVSDNFREDVADAGSA
jgi:hypothetical protein